MKTELNTRLMVENVARYMMQSNTAWDVVAAMVKWIRKQLKESEIQRRHRKKILQLKTHKVVATQLE